ncbi:MAG: glycoside hydrolase family 88 protein [Ignavibacteriales bacterium]|nr:glycoside hydrolase family 88 protein [Ignavibacteriales bacterium]
MRLTNLIFILIFIILSTELFAQINDKYLENITNQIIQKDETFDGRYPEVTVDGIYSYREKVNWFSGFLGGELWNLYDITNNEELKKRALIQADALLDFATIDYTHDMGFIFFPSVVKAYIETGDKKYREAGITAARMLLKRFNKNGNFIKAWGALSDTSKAGWMIIDTMLNLELLFWAWQETGEVEFYDVAYMHAITCMKEHVRDDFSSYHVIEFNPESGEVTKRRTHQGWQDETTWARGQAWGIYGFANAFKYTNDERFLNTSKKMADFFIQKLPSDFVPYWDLDLSGDDVVRDASAGAIASSGLYILSEQVKLKEDYQKYSSAADKIAESLINNYTFLNSKREKDEGLLIHTVYNYHKNWGVDESFPCGDYYFTETLEKYNAAQKKKLKKTENLRGQILLNENWFYLEDNIQNREDLVNSTKKWEKINLPHSWNKFDAVDPIPGYRRATSWYEKEFTIDEIDNSKLYKLYFEGVNISSEIFLNNQKVGSHVGGYVGFDIDITNELKIGKNKLLVKADNSINLDIIPSQVSDFFIYGGITRDVWLKVLPKTNFSHLKISSPKVSNESASTKVDCEIESDQEVNSEIKISIIDKNQGEVLTSNHKVYIIKGNNKLNFELDEIKNPELWSPENPNLYKIKFELFANNKKLDETIEKFGYRWFEFKDNGPFYLNGKRLVLRGTHRHEDHAGLANALTNDQHRKDIRMIKEMGANFVRLAHYPQDPEVYKTCDELGLLVWDELPWCRGGVGDSEWKENTKRLFVEMINQNYNHPSIIIWSVGNEVYWLPERENGGNIDTLKEFTNQLVNIAHDLDPGRVTSIRKFYEGADIVDVFSPSIWAGWYSGVYKSYENAIADAQKKYKKFFHAEYGASSHIGRHSENPITGEGFVNPDEWSENENQVKVQNIAKIGDWSENYAVDLFDWHLKTSETNKNFTGNAQWAFKDFGTPLRPENAIPYMNQKGLVDREGNPKDAYYVFKSYWNESDKFVYIESPTWDERSGPVNVQKEICVFSNCNEVELFLNTKSLGKKKKDITKFPASGLSWEVSFVSGKNVIEAIGFGGNEKIAEHKIDVNYSFEKNLAAEKFELSSERLSNGNFLVTAIAVDKDNNRCVDFNEKIYFSSEGSGNLICNFGTPTKSSIIEMANGKAQIEVNTKPFEKTTVEIRSQDLKGNFLVINGIIE